MINSWQRREKYYLFNNLAPTLVLDLLPGSLIPFSLRSFITKLCTRSKILLWDDGFGTPTWRRKVARAQPCAWSRADLALSSLLIITEINELKLQMKILKFFSFRKKDLWSFCKKDNMKIAMINTYMKFSMWGMRCFSIILASWLLSRLSLSSSTP